VVVRRLNIDPEINVVLHSIRSNSRRIATRIGIGNCDTDRSARVELAGDPDPEIRDARITAYVSVDTDPGKAFDAIASPDGYRKLMEGVADVTGEGWQLRFSPPGGAESGFEEEVTPDPGGRSLAIVRRYSEGREVRLAFRVEERDGATYLVREAILAGAREDLLKNDYARGRLAGTLAVDLLAWSRLVS
jgi:hypothetical protein